MFYVYFFQVLSVYNIFLFFLVFTIFSAASWEVCIVLLDMIEVLFPVLASWEVLGLKQVTKELKNFKFICF